MAPLSTTNCIFCLKKANIFSGHLKREHRTVIVGMCNECSENKEYRGLFNNKGRINIEFKEEFGLNKRIKVEHSNVKLVLIEIDLLEQKVSSLRKSIQQL